MRNPFFFFGIFAAIGVPCLLLAFYFEITTIQKVISWEEVDGVVNGYDDSNYPLIKFDYQGKQYEFGSDYKGDDINDGDTISIFFPPGKPEAAEVNSFFGNWFLPMFLSIFGFAFGGIGIFGIVSQSKKSKAKKELFIEQRGKKLSGLPASVSRNTSLKVNGRSPFMISTQWTDPLTQTSYTFKSENIWEDPSSFIPNGKIDVYVDEADLKRYYVDVTFLEKQGQTA